MLLKECESKAEMLKNYKLLLEVYPKLTLEEYSQELDFMLQNNYGQVGVYLNDECIGLSGYWIGSKLWCGRYLEADNVVIAEAHRSKGIGNLIFDYLKQKAQKEKCSMVSLDSYTTNFKAHKFFYNEGFEPRGFHFINILDKSKIR
jgi:GNAT superfamily N-acetyltransferase